MSDAGKTDLLGRVLRIATLVTAVVGAIVGVIALVREFLPDPTPPPNRISGEFLRVEIEPDVSLAAYREREPGQPARCAGFQPPAPAAKEIARASQRSGGWVPLATVRIGAGAQRIAQTLDTTATGTTAAPASTATTPTGPEGATSTTATSTTTTATSTTTTDATPTTATPTTTTDGKARMPASPASTLAGVAKLSPKQTVALLESTFSKDSAAAAAAIKRIRTGKSAGSAALQREIAKLAPYLLGEIVSFKVRIIGLVRRCSYVRWSLYDARTGRRSKESQLANRDALFFHPEAVEDDAISEVWVGLPRRKGPFHVLLELFKDEGGQLDRAKSPTFPH